MGASIVCCSERPVELGPRDSHQMREHGRIPKPPQNPKGIQKYFEREKQDEEAAQLHRQRSDSDQEPHDNINTTVSPAKFSTNNLPQMGDAPTVRKILKEDIKHVYDFHKLIGSGHYGQVRLATAKSNKNKVIAIKSIPRKIIDKEILLLEQELVIMLQVDHPNIIKFYEAYRDNKYYHLVMELCSGGELFEKLCERGTFTEADGARIIHKILSAIRYLHELNIAHRDLKPENIIFANDQPDSEIKLIDFGLSKKHFKDQQMQTKLGTPYYVSPEVLEGKYDKMCDLWGIGVITYMLLCGYPPFNGSTEAEVFRKIKTCDYQFYDPEWSDISETAKDFISKLLEPIPSKRMCAEKALDHPWIKNAPTHAFLAPEVLTRLSYFRSPMRIQRELILMLINIIDDEQFLMTKRTFQAIDVDNSGHISVAELKKAYSGIGQERPDQEVELIMNRVDIDQNGEINYSEFLAGTLDPSHYSEDNLIKLFQKLDVGNNMVITPQDLVTVFKRQGKYLNVEEVEEMFKEIGMEEKLQYKDFCELMKTIIINH